MPIIGCVQTPDPTPASFEREQGGVYPRPAGLWVFGERLTWVAGLVLMLSAFTDWYAGSGDGFTLSVIG